MNAESEMAGADGPGGEPKRLDPCAQIAESVGYGDGADGGDFGGIDALIDYKNALEDALRRALDENDIYSVEREREDSPK